MKCVMLRCAKSIIVLSVLSFRGLIVGLNMTTSKQGTRLTPRGEMVADILTAVLFITMGYAIVKATAIVVVRVGQFLGII
jgi:uncharacterized membrane protein YhdT